MGLHFLFTGTLDDEVDRRKEIEQHDGWPKSHDLREKFGGPLCKCGAVFFKHSDPPMVGHRPWSSRTVV